MQLLHSLPLTEHRQLLEGTPGLLATSQAILMLLGGDSRESDRALSLHATDWSGLPLWKLDVSADPPLAFCAASDTIALVTTKSGTVQELDLVSSRISNIYTTEDQQPIYRVTTAQDKSGALLVISALANGSIDIWDYAARKLRFHLPPAVPGMEVFSMTIKDALLACNCGSSIAVWDLTTGELARIITMSQTVFRTVFINDELLASGGMEGVVWLWNWKTGDIIATLDKRPHKKKCYINGLCLYQQNMLLTTNTRGYVSLWSLETKELINQIKVHDKAITVRDVVGDILLTVGKEGGDVGDSCGLNCTLKSCNLLEMVGGGKIVPVEHGFPCLMIWEVALYNDRLAVGLLKRNKPHVEIWSLNES